MPGLIQPATRPEVQVGADSGVTCVGSYVDEAVDGLPGCYRAGRQEVARSRRFSSKSSGELCRRRRCRTTLLRSGSSNEDGGEPANISASGGEQSNTRDARAAQKHSCVSVGKPARRRLRSTSGRGAIFLGLMVLAAARREIAHGTAAYFVVARRREARVRALLTAHGGAIRRERRRRRADSRRDVAEQLKGQSTCSNTTEWPGNCKDEPAAIFSDGSSPSRPVCATTV